MDKWKLQSFSITHYLYIVFFFSCLIKVSIQVAPVIHIRDPAGQYKWSWSDAQRACAERGLTLASPAQLKDAYQGWNLSVCACGWLSDGRAQFPFTKSRVGCGQRPGIHNCPRDPGAWRQKGWNAYCSNQIAPVIHIRDPAGQYKWSWSDAQRACAERGLTLASPAQLNAAHQGWNLDVCACGWLSDGSVQYPITKARPGCGSEPGVQTCPRDPHQWRQKGWDAFCSTNTAPVQDKQQPAGRLPAALHGCSEGGLSLASSVQLDDAHLFRELKFIIGISFLYVMDEDNPHLTDHKFPFGMEIESRHISLTEENSEKTPEDVQVDMDYLEYHYSQDREYMDFPWEMERDRSGFEIRHYTTNVAEDGLASQLGIEEGDEVVALGMYPLVDAPHKLTLDIAASLLKVDQPFKLIHRRQACQDGEKGWLVTVVTGVVKTRGVRDTHEERRISWKKYHAQIIHTTSFFIKSGSSTWIGPLWSEDVTISPKTNPSKYMMYDGSSSGVYFKLQTSKDNPQYVFTLLTYTNSSGKIYIIFRKTVSAGSYKFIRNDNSDSKGTHVAMENKTVASSGYPSNVHRDIAYKLTAVTTSKWALETQYKGSYLTARTQASSIRLWWKTVNGTPIEEHDDCLFNIFVKKNN